MMHFLATRNWWRCSSMRDCRSLVEVHFLAVDGATKHDFTFDCHQAGRYAFFGTKTWME